MLTSLGAEVIQVKTPQQLDSVDGLVLPGGESTVQQKLSETFGLFNPIQQRISEGMPVLGTCAGLIMLADEIIDGIEDQRSFGGLDISVRRNAFGRQVDSFESDIEFDDGSADLIRAVFIRAPWVERVGEGVQVLASVDKHPVAVRSQTMLATSFHPELTGDHRIHRYFIEEVARPALEKVK